MLAIMQMGASREAARNLVLKYYAVHRSFRLQLTEMVGIIRDKDESAADTFVSLLMAAMVHEMHEAHLNMSVPWHMALDLGSRIFRALHPEFHGFECRRAPSDGTPRPILDLIDDHGISRVVVLSSGQVQLAPSVKADEAARLFWQEVQRQAADFLISAHSSSAPDSELN